MFWISCIIQVWRDIQVKNVCRTAWDENTTGIPLRTMNEQSWGIATSALKMSTLMKRDVPYNYILANGTLELVARDILGIFPKTLSSNQTVVVTMDHYSKLKRAVLTWKTTVSHIASRFIDKWIIWNGMSMYVCWTTRRDWIQRFSSRYGPSWERCIWRLLLALSKGVDRQNDLIRRLSSRQKHCLVEHQQEWDICVQPLTYVYSAQ